MTVNIYLEDWSNGMRDSQAYVFEMMDELRDQPITRYMLGSTLPRAFRSAPTQSRPVTGSPNNSQSVTISRLPRA